jgi:hypothetical protein
MSAAAMRTGSPLSRAAFVLFNALALAIVYLAAIEPALEWFAAQRVAIEDKRDVLDRYTRALERTAEAPPASAAELFLPGASDPRRSAALQDIIKRVAERTGVRIQSVSGLSPNREKSGVVGVRVDMVGPLRSLAMAVAGLESATPALVVGRAAIRASAVRDETPGLLTPLDAQLDIYGFAAP